MSQPVPRKVIDEIVRLRRDGMLIADIARRVGYSEATISKRCREAGVTPYSQSITPGVRQEIQQALAAGRSYTEIARLFGVTLWTIRKIAQELPEAVAGVAGPAWGYAPEAQS